MLMKRSMIARVVSFGSLLLDSELNAAITAVSAFGVDENEALECALRAGVPDHADTVPLPGEERQGHRAIEGTGLARGVCRFPHALEGVPREHAVAPLRVADTHEKAHVAHHVGDRRGSGPRC